jgi:hypothetical protein
VKILSKAETGELDTGQIALIKDEIKDCQNNEIFHIIGFAIGLIIGGFSSFVVHVTALTVGCFIMAAISGLAGLYYTDKRQKLEQRIKRRSGRIG